MTQDVEPTRSRAERSRARKAEIIEAALALFAERGEHGTTVAAVAEKVGVTDAGVLYHFGTKEELLTAVLAHYDLLYYDQLYLDRADQPRGMSLLEEGWREVGAAMELTPMVVALHARLATEHLNRDTPTRRFFEARYENFRSLLEATFLEAIEDGDLRSDCDVTAEVSDLVAFIDGTRVQWFYSDRRISMADAVRRYMDNMFDRLRPPARTRRDTPRASR